MSETNETNASEATETENDSVLSADLLHAVMLRYDVKPFALFDPTNVEGRALELYKLESALHKIKGQLDKHSANSKAGATSSAANYRAIVADQDYNPESASAKKFEKFKALLDEAFEELIEDEQALAYARPYLYNKMNGCDSLIEYNLARHENKRSDIIHSAIVLAKEFRMIRLTLIQLGVKASTLPKALTGKFGTALDDTQYAARFHAVDYSTVVMVDGEPDPETGSVPQEEVIRDFAPGEHFHFIARALGCPLSTPDGKILTYATFEEWFERAYNFNYDRLIHYGQGETVYLTPIRAIAGADAPDVILTVNRSI